MIMEKSLLINKIEKKIKIEKKNPCTSCSKKKCRVDLLVIVLAFLGCHIVQAILSWGFFLGRLGLWGDEWGYWYPIPSKVPVEVSDPSVAENAPIFSEDNDDSEVKFLDIRLIAGPSRSRDSLSSKSIFLALSHLSTSRNMKPSTKLSPKRLRSSAVLVRMCEPANFIQPRLQQREGLGVRHRKKAAAIGYGVSANVKTTRKAASKKAIAEEKKEAEGRKFTKAKKPWTDEISQLTDDFLELESFKLM